MLARLLTVVAAVVSLVGFLAEQHGTQSWWPYHVDRAGYVLIILAVVAALLSKREASVITLVLQILAAAAAVAFMIVGLVKFYDSTAVFNGATFAVYPWVTEAVSLAVAAFAFGLTLERRRSTAVVASLMAATGVTVGCAIYAITREANLASEVWWIAAIVGAFLAAAAAAQHEREGDVASGVPAPTFDAPVLSGAAVVEPAADDNVE